jgi:HPt (histidine-containing phosphotransfer) domain-containing protein
VGGDDVLRLVAEVFPEECERQMGMIRQARAEGNPEGVERAAHALKGSISVFAAEGAYEAAQRLEAMGREGDLAAFDETWHALQAEVEKLKATLDALLRNGDLASDRAGGKQGSLSPGGGR